jgi:hypothetical protein
MPFDPRDAMHKFRAVIMIRADPSVTTLIVFAGKDETWRFERAWLTKRSVVEPVKN